MDEIHEQLGQLLQDMTGDPSLKKQAISDITAKPRAEAIKPWLEMLVKRAGEAAKEIDKRASDSQEQQRKYLDQIKAAKETLQKLDGLPDPGTLVSLCADIDAKREDSKDTHEAKLQRREKALAELNRVRRAFVAHPAVVAYRSNPFDEGRTYALVMGAFHRAEIGILVSVDPYAA